MEAEEDIRVDERKVMAKELTENEKERLERFWKRWGFQCMLPTLDSLFKYVIPEARINSVEFESPDGQRWDCWLNNQNLPIDESIVGAAFMQDTPATALFMALEKLKVEQHG